MFNWHSLTTICQSVTETGYLQLKKLLQHTILTASLNDTIHIKEYSYMVQICNHGHYLNKSYYGAVRSGTIYPHILLHIAHSLFFF
jgi:hypothetical protein